MVLKAELDQVSAQIETQFPASHIGGVFIDAWNLEHRIGALFWPCNFVSGWCRAILCRFLEHELFHFPPARFVASDDDSQRCFLCFDDLLSFGVFRCGVKTFSALPLSFIIRLLFASRARRTRALLFGPHDSSASSLASDSSSSGKSSYSSSSIKATFRFRWGRSGFRRFCFVDDGSRRFAGFADDAIALFASRSPPFAFPTWLISAMSPPLRSPLVIPCLCRRLCFRLSDEFRPMWCWTDSLRAWEFWDSAYTSVVRLCGDRLELAVSKRAISSATVRSILVELYCRLLLDSRLVSSYDHAKATELEFCYNTGHQRIRFRQVRQPLYPTPCPQILQRYRWESCFAEEAAFPFCLTNHRSWHTWVRWSTRSVLHVHTLTSHPGTMSRGRCCVSLIKRLSVSLLAYSSAIVWFMMRSSSNWELLVALCKWCQVVGYERSPKSSGFI